MKLKETINLLEELVIIFKDYQTRDDISKRWSYPSVCVTAFTILDIYTNNMYWIKRHVNSNSGFWITQYVNPDIALKLRLFILEKELKHHKKWGILARYFKPF